LREFAKKLGNVSAAHISDIENGRRNPSDELLHKMAQILNVSLDELKKLDSRVPVEELKREMRHDPALGFALRKIAEEKIPSDRLLEFIEEQRNRKKERDR